MHFLFKNIQNWNCFVASFALWWPIVFDIVQIFRFFVLDRWFIRFWKIRSFSHLCGSHDPDPLFSEFEKIVEPSNHVHELAISKFGKIHFDEEFLKTKANFGHVSKSEWKMKDLASKFVKMSYARSLKMRPAQKIFLDQNLEYLQIFVRHHPHLRLRISEFLRIRNLILEFFRNPVIRFRIPMAGTWHWLKPRCNRQSPKVLQVHVWGSSYSYETY